MDTKSIVYIALFAALTAALAFFPPLTIPVVGVPITAQSLGVMLAGAVAGAKRGGLAMVLFLALVAAGLPLLSGGRGGIGIFYGASGGFLLAWPLSAAVIGYLISKSPTANFLMTAVYIALGGIVLMYAIGIPWVAAVAGIPLSSAFTGSMAFVPGDLVKVVLATIIARGIRRAYPNL